MTTATFEPLTESDIQSIVLRTFVMSDADGWFYPRQPGIPLVRVFASNSRFLVERRRKHTTDWMRLISTDMHEFSEAAFAQWQEHWPLTYHG